MNMAMCKNDKNHVLYSQKLCTRYPLSQKPVNAPSQLVDRYPIFFKKNIYKKLTKKILLPNITVEKIGPY